jgi:hypothetical protein
VTTGVGAETMTAAITVSFCRGFDGSLRMLG